MATLQVKGMDDQLYDALKLQAQRQNRSISQEVVNIIENSLAAAKNRSEEATLEFLKLCGSWEGEEDAESLIASIRDSRENQSRQERMDNVFD